MDIVADLDESTDPDARLEGLFSDSHTVARDHFDYDSRLCVDAAISQSQLPDQCFVIADISVSDSFSTKNTDA